MGVPRPRELEASLWLVAFLCRKGFPFYQGCAWTRVQRGTNPVPAPSSERGLLAFCALEPLLPHPSPSPVFSILPHPSSIYTSVQPSTRLSIIQPAPIHRASTHLFTHPSNLCPSIHSSHVHPSIPLSRTSLFSVDSRPREPSASLTEAAGSERSPEERWARAEDSPGTNTMRGQGTRRLPSINQSVSQSINHRPMCTHYTPGTVLGAGDRVGSKLDPSPSPSGGDGQ